MGFALTLSGVSAHAQGVAGNPRPASTQTFSKDYQALLDQGWRPASEFPNVIDNLPFKITLEEIGSYNDNLLLLPKNAIVPPGASRGDFYSTTNIGLSSRATVGAQAFFVRGNYGITRYVNNTSLDNQTYLAEGGMEWVFTARCSGTLIASSRQIQAPYEELTSFVTNDIRTNAVKETAKCSIADNVALILDSGASRTTNSLLAQSANDYDQYYIRGGAEYKIADLNTLGGKITYTHSDYFNRSAVTTPGLSTGLEQMEYAIYYRRLFSPKLEFDGTFGFTDSTTVSPLGQSSFVKPTYSVGLKWSATPKITVVVTNSQTVAPPQNIVADYQRIRSNSVIVTYAFSPKLDFNFGLRQADIDNPTTSGFGGSPVLVSQRVYGANVRAVYHFTPLMDGYAEYRYTQRKDDTTGFLASANVFMLGLKYQR
jgi:hypothetical protein